MTRIVGIQEFEPKPGVSEAELEQALRAFIERMVYPGWKASVIKSDRGTHKGVYGLMIEVESAEARDRIVNENGFTAEKEQYDLSHPELYPAWQHIFSLVIQPNRWVDYQIL